MQLELNTATWDLELDAAGNIKTLGSDDPAALLSQRVCHRLQTFRGECYLDRSVGVPYFAEVLKKRPDVSRIRSLFASVIAGVEGVAQILSLDLRFVQSSRRLSVSFRVKGAAGEIAEGAL